MNSKIIKPIFQCQSSIYNFSSISSSPLDLAENADKYRTDPDAKPPFSYATIICLAMRANNNKVSLSNIYAWIRENFLFYKYADPAWQVKEISSFTRKLVPPNNSAIKDII